MKWRLVIRPRAEADLREAQDWYESQRAGLGAEFVAEIDATMREQGRHLCVRSKCSSDFGIENEKF